MDIAKFTHAWGGDKELGNIKKLFIAVGLDQKSSGYIILDEIKILK